jgi:hypothetical protein
MAAAVSRNFGRRSMSDDLQPIETVQSPGAQPRTGVTTPENPRSRGHSPALDHRDGLTPKPPSGQSDQTSKAGTAANADTPPKKIKVGDYELSSDDVVGLMQRKAAEDLRKASGPADPAACELKLPENLTLPTGSEFKLDPADPSYETVRAWAHGKQFDQQTFSEMLGLYASHRAREDAMIATARKAEAEKLGVNGPIRVTAIEKRVRNSTSGGRHDR